MGIATEAITNNSSSSIGERRLWCFVLLTAVAGAKKGVPGAMEYFESIQCRDICGFLGINISWLRLQAKSPKPLGEEVNMIYLRDPNIDYRIQKRARAKSRLEESSNKGQWITGPGASIALESGVQCL
jgi:hypothetical protein